jgi:bla regulator protein BlaR1
MNGFIDLQYPLTQALGMAVLHSFWQGIIIFFLVRMILSLVPQHKAGTRHNVAYAALTILFFSFIFSFFSEWQISAHTLVLASTQAHGTLQPDYIQPVWSSWSSLFSFRYIHLFNSYIPLVAVMYTLGLVTLCGKMIWNLLQVQYLRKQVMLPDSLLQQKFIQLKEQAGVRKNVLLRYSEKITVPLVFGYIKPLILVPCSLIHRLDPQQMETILLHELAHSRRNDYLWNLLQMVMETLMFFNPAAWFISRIIRQEREHRCDDYVLNITKKPLPYAHALLLLEENRISVTSVALAASGNNKNSLLNRIKRLTDMKRETKPSQKTLATVSIILILAAMVCFATAFGQEKREDGNTKKISKSYSKVVIVDDNGKVTTYPKSDGDTTGMAEAMKAVPEAMEMAHKAMKDVDMKEIRKTVKISMDQAGKAMVVANQAMKDIDWDDIQAKVDEAMKTAHKSIKEVDWEHINKEMEGARKEVAQAMKEAHMEMKDIDWTEINKAIDDAQSDIKKTKIIIKKSYKDDKHEDDEDED